jgi:hypothetical protein
MRRAILPIDAIPNATAMVLYACASFFEAPLEHAVCVQSQKSTTRHRSP